MRTFRWLCILLAAQVCCVDAVGAQNQQSGRPTTGRGTFAVPEHGDVYVTALPGESQVWVDGSYAGQTPLLAELAPGRHRITVLHAGWLPENSSLTAAVGRVEALNVIMHPIRTPASGADGVLHGALSVRGALNGANVYIDGIKAGTIPLDRRQINAGNHTVTVGDSHVNRIVRAAVIYPDTTTVVVLSLGVPAGAVSHADDMLAPLYAYIPPNSVNIFGDDVIVHHNGMELQCRIGSRAYMLNGRAALAALAPTLIGGKIFLPLSLMKRMK